MPGPGVNFMKPNGFVAAASITSQTSTPSLSQTIAISFTRPMFTERNVFSSSFTSSAALGARHGHDRVDARRVERRRDLGARRRDAADDLRRVLRVPLRIARIDALGAEREEDVLADREARCFERRAASPRASFPDTSCSRARSSSPGCALRAIASRRRDDVAHVRIARLRRAASARRSRSRRICRAATRRSSPRSFPLFTSFATSALGTSWMCDLPAMSSCARRARSRRSR